MNEIEYIVLAENFGEFLGMAQECLERKDHKASGVLASAVFEDTMRKIATKHDLGAYSGIDKNINGLKSRGVMENLQAKQARVWANVRNKAFHAEWDKYELGDVKSMIEGVRGLIDKYLV